MRASTLALLARSLKQDSRHPFSHFMRFGLLGFTLWMLIMAHNQGRGLSAPGLRFFESLTWLNFIFVTTAGITFFATAITEEKEEETVGLLRMAGIGPLGLLLGKSVPRWFNALLLLSLQFPFTLLAIALGGVTMHQVQTAYCSIVAYLFALGNIALFSSVVCRTSNRASWMTAILLAVYLFGPFIVGLLLRAMFIRTPGPVSSFVGLLESSSTLFQLASIMRSGFSSAILGPQVIVCLVIAVVFFALAWLSAERCITDDASGGNAEITLPGLPASRNRAPVSRVWINALAWKDFHFLTGGLRWIALKFAIYGFLLYAFISLLLITSGRYGPGRRQIGGFILGCAFFVLAGEIALAASRIFREELRNHTHAGLMMLPYFTSQVVYGKIAGFALSLLPAVFYLVLGLLIAPENWAELIREAPHPEVWWLFFMYVLFVHLTAYLSLIVKWGALPLAAGAVVLLNACCLTPFVLAGPRQGGVFVMLAFGALIASGLLHALISEQLRLRAAE